MAQDNSTSISLNKYISSTGLCSRREANKLIESGRVTINGLKAVLGNRVEEGDIVKLDNRPVVNEVRPIYIALNKPPGIVSTTDRREKANIISFINHPERLFPIGRLDKYSEGLIFLTNNGDIVNKILRAGNHHEKEYIVSVNKPITKKFLFEMGDGIPMLGTVTHKCKVEKINKNTFRIVLTQGLNRQIRRMCEYLGYKVSKLKRVRIMNIKLGNLKSGQYRELTPNELQKIKAAVKNSSKTQ